MTRVQAAEYIAARWGLQCARATLAKLAAAGGGPAYSRFGRCAVYRPEDLDAWVRARLGATKEGVR
ncbi:hypothetical protein SLNSH_06285 [Alsobacter soli]|uniref:DNA-binding protein n=1 Tax=Alsobacter soli TaxID=2109933 RepID=A0A2T1HWL1_9HYPH|nr:hypothetical protein SLNSH_06285 [Alsobacter soli]